MAPAWSAPTSLLSIFTMMSPASSPACSAGEPSIGRKIFTPASSATTSMPTPGYEPMVGQADLFELIGVEIGGVRIERRDHAAYRFFHEGLVVDFVDVLALDALVDFGEEAGLFPRKRGGRTGGLVPVFSPGRHRQWRRRNQRPLPRRERSACATASSFFSRPHQSIRLEILQASAAGQRKSVKT